MKPRRSPPTAHGKKTCAAAPNVGASMADWTQAAVIWPGEISWPAELGDVYPKIVPPLRTDRDTVVVGAASAPLDKPIAIHVHAERSCRARSICAWTARPQAEGNGQAFLAQVVELARGDGGVTLPTVGSAGLAETGRMLESGVDGLTDLAERAVATGDMQAAEGGLAGRARSAIRATCRRKPCSASIQRKQRRGAAQSRKRRRRAGSDLNLVRPAPIAAASAAGARPEPVIRRAEARAFPRRVR